MEPGFEAGMSADRLRRALQAPTASQRLQVALTAGTHPEPAYVEVLVDQCALESDFYVRDMLTWALIHHPHQLVIDQLLPQLSSEIPQARSQALHTLSKIGDPQTWPYVTPELMFDADDEVARTAWRAAVAVAPRQEWPQLAAMLVTQLGRGDRVVCRSLTQALLALGDVAAEQLVAALRSDDPAVRIHAIATERLIVDPYEGFDWAYEMARQWAQPEGRSARSGEEHPGGQANGHAE